MTDGAADLIVGTVRGRRGGDTPEPFGLVSTFLGVVYEGACGSRWSGVAILGGGLLRATLGGGAESLGDITRNISGAVVGFGERR